MTGQQRTPALRGVQVGRGRRIEESFSTQATDWQAAGLCAQPGARADDWFDGFEYGGVKAPDDTTDKTARAKALCKGCPIAVQCLVFAVEENLTHGVFGGLTPNQRALRGARLVAEYRGAA